MSSAANEDTVLEQLANVGQALCAYACCFPPSDEMVWRIPRGVGGPAALGETSAAWKSGANALQEIQRQLREQTDALGEETWRGKDRDAFETELSNLLAEIGDSHNTAEAIGITLEVLAPVLAVWPPLCFTAGMAVAAVATAFYIALGSGVGNLVGASEAAYEIGLPVAEAMLLMLTVAEGILVTALAIAEGVIAGAVTTDVIVQEKHGDSAIIGDLGQAEVDGLGQLAVNLVQYGISRALDGKKPGGEGGEAASGAGESGTGESGSGEGSGESGTGESGTGESGTGEGSGEGSGESGSGEGSEPAPKKPWEEGAERGKRRWHEVGKEAGKIGADTAQRQAADRTHAGSRLQQLINDKSGWEGTE